MYDNRVMSIEEVACAFVSAGLTVSSSCLTTHHYAYSETLATIHKVSAPLFAETIPACTFSACWN